MLLHLPDKFYIISSQNVFVKSKSLIITDGIFLHSFQPSGASLSRTQAYSSQHCKQMENLLLRSLFVVI